MKCFCGAPALLRDSKWGKWYACTRFPACDGAVGCHKGTDRPLGTLADKPTRQARKEAHEAFDPLWQDGDMTRSEAYAWLASEMGLGEVHIGEMSREECAQVVELVEAEGFGLSEHAL